MPVCGSPKLIAAYHVLHRLSDPRHPPCALICFKKINIYTDVTLCKRIYKSTITTFYSQYVKELNQFIDQYKYCLTMKMQIMWIWTTYSLMSYLIWKELIFWWRISESNRWPSACKADALANWANPPNWVVSLQLAVCSCEVSQL